MNEDKEKKTYELALLVKQEEDVARVMEFVRQHNAEVATEPRAKKLALAYKIKGNTEAVFVSCNFIAAGEDAKNLEHDLRMREDVVRAMILRAPLQTEKREVAAPYQFPREKRGKPFTEARPAAPRPLSNEALEKKIEEILG